MSRSKRWGLRLKRALDLAVAGLALVVLSPLLLLIALVVRLDSPGPALFRQVRIGWRRKPFEVWKFRTMVRDAPSAPHREHVRRLILGNGDAPAAPRGASFKLEDDPRITRFGRWLRTSSLDELPQLVNVLRGDMSLVGPRPIVPYECELYEGPQLERFDMPPGMSGLWQVSGRGKLDYRRMCELDVEYVRRWSLGLDLAILAKTLPALIHHREPLARRRRGEPSERGTS